VTRTEQYYDLKIADITVPSGSSITQANITDTRMNESVCGFVTCLLRVESTEDLFAQYDSMFNAWFDTVKNQVTGDLAIRLQAEFEDLNETVEDYQDAVEADIAQYKSDVQADIAQYEATLNTTVQNYQATVTQTANAANTTAQAANQTISDFVAADFVLPLQNLTFTNKRCVINDSRVTASSLIDVYFTEDTMIAAETARIYVDSASGQIILTAETQPASTLKARIRVRVM
jgi:dGTP triphosphohydrolase